MSLIGMLHHKKDPTFVKKAYAFAAVAKMESIPFCYFSYQCVDLENKQVDGWIYNEGVWKKQVLDFPEVIINLSGPKTNFQKDVYRELKRIIPFTSHSVGNKMKVYKKIMKTREFSEFLIPTVSLEKTNNLFEFLEQYERIVIKPFSGNHGKKIMFIDRVKDNKFKVTDGEKSELYHFDQFNQLLAELKKEQKYLVQPFIECKTKAGLPYDFRLHVQKNGSGLWEITLIYPRISGNGKLVSNISSGGYRGELIPFLKTEFSEEYYNVKRLLEHFALTFAAHLDTLYNKSFDELGIDVGIDINHKLWIYEVNWRPGSKHREFEVAKRLVMYAKYLADRR